MVRGVCPVCGNSEWVCSGCSVVCFFCGSPLEVVNDGC